MIVKAKPFDAEAFAPFGQVLGGEGKKEERHPYAARMENLRPGAAANMTFMRVLPVTLPIRIKTLERHVYSNQTFIPLNGTRHLIAVCPSDENGQPVLSRLVAFSAKGSQAVNYNANIWHAPRTAISSPGEFVMFRWDADDEDDTELFEVDATIEVLL